MEVAVLIDILTCILFMTRLKLLFYRNIVAPGKEKHKFYVFSQGQLSTVQKSFKYFVVSPISMPIFQRRGGFCHGLTILEAYIRWRLKVAFIFHTLFMQEPRLEI